MSSFAEYEEEWVVPLTLQELRELNTHSAFDTWAGIELVAAAAGEAELHLAARPDLMQHLGFLHAGVLGALIDRSCGFAAATSVGAVLASQYQVLCYKPAIGSHFTARATVDRAGKRQVFASARVYAQNEEAELLVAAGNAVLIVAQ